MDAALASVVGGLTPAPVIGVPTSTGYGSAFGGVSALLAMLNSCAAALAVVNIDDGFGAGTIAATHRAACGRGGRGDPVHRLRRRGRRRHAARRAAGCGRGCRRGPGGPGGNRRCRARPAARRASSGTASRRRTSTSSRRRARASDLARRARDRRGGIAGRRGRDARALDAFRRLARGRGTDPPAPARRGAASTRSARSTRSGTSSGSASRLPRSAPTRSRARRCRPREGSCARHMAGFPCRHRRRSRFCGRPGAPLVPLEVGVELVTPTGAALVAALATTFGAYPAMVPRQIGYGAGTRDPEECRTSSASSSATRPVGLARAESADLPHRGEHRRSLARARSRRRRRRQRGRGARRLDGARADEEGTPGLRDVRARAAARARGGRRDRSCATRARSACASRASTATSSSATWSPSTSPGGDGARQARLARRRARQPRAGARRLRCGSRHGSADRCRPSGQARSPPPSERGRRWQRTT